MHLIVGGFVEGDNLRPDRVIKGKRGPSVGKGGKSYVES
jgi:hypothetical protein